MKKKQSFKAEKYMIITASILLVVALVCIIFLVMHEAGVFEHIGKPGDTTDADTTVPVASVEHEDVETETNSDGTPSKVVYYKDNVFDGSIDYVYDGDAVYEVHFDADNKLERSIKKQINEIGNLIYESYSTADAVLYEIEYTYYDDMDTLWKKTTTEFEEEKELTTKELYSENGLMTDKYVYEDSVEVSHTVYTYDENGEIVNEEEVST